MDITEAVNYNRNKPEYRGLSFTKFAVQLIKENGGNFYGYSNPDTLRRALPELIKTPHNPVPDFNEEFTIDIPAGYFDDRTPHILPSLYKNVLLLGDIHAPYHNAMALTTALRYGHEHGIDAIILNGDFIDFYGISRFSKKPNKPSLKDEIEIAKTILERIRDKFGDIKIVWKDGNHDERLDKYIADKAPEIYDLDEKPSVRTLLELDKLRIDYVSDKRVIKIGKLNLIHGHEILSGAGAVNLARTVRLKANANVAFNHFHKTQEDIYTNIEGETIGSWAIGCLCDLSPEYMPFNGWNWGFGRVVVSEDGTFEMENRKIIGGKVK